MKKVLLITPSINMGGMQSAMVTLANGLEEEGISVEMYALFRLDHFFKLNPSIAFYESAKSPQAYNTLTRIAAIVRDVRKVVRESDAKEVIVYGKFYAALTLLASWGLNKRIFISDRASSLYRDKWYVEMITKIIYSFLKPTGVIAQTTNSALFQRKRFGKQIPIEIIPNAVREMEINAMPKENIVLAVGRFGDTLKGFDRLIEAWGKVRQSGWGLVFAGGAEQEEPQYGVRAKELEVYGRISFLGKVNDLDEWYSRSRIFVIPSRSEGFPNALAEAMSAGLACVAFDFTAGPRDIIHDQIDGIIVPDGDIDALAATIERLINDDELCSRLSEQALGSKERFSKKTIINKILNFIFE